MNNNKVVVHNLPDSLSLQDVKAFLSDVSNGTINVKQCDRANNKTLSKASYIVHLNTPEEAQMLVVFRRATLSSTLEIIFLKTQDLMEFSARLVLNLGKRGVSQDQKRVACLFLYGLNCIVRGELYERILKDMTHFKFPLLRKFYSKLQS